jgi:hypothetical protein
MGMALSVIADHACHPFDRPGSAAKSLALASSETHLGGGFASQGVPTEDAAKRFKSDFANWHQGALSHKVSGTLKTA